MGRELVERDTKKNGRRGCRVFGVPGVQQLCGLQVNQRQWALLASATPS